MLASSGLYGGVFFDTADGTPTWDRDTLARVARAVRRMDNREEQGFHVLAYDRVMFDPTRSLAIVVHPGDMIELSYDRDALDRQEGLAEEMRAFESDGWDVVFLHRMSCSQFATGHRTTVARNLANRVRSLRAKASILYGDDLDAAVRWLAEHAHLRQRPSVFLGGAYGDAQHGCVTYVGKGIARLTAAPLAFSRHIPTPSGTCWVPEGHTPSA